MILPTIEACFNCFGTPLSDAEKIKDDNKTHEIQNLRNHPHTPSSPAIGGKGGLSKMARGHLFFFNRMPDDQAMLQ